MGLTSGPRVGNSWYATQDNARLSPPLSRYSEQFKEARYASSGPLAVFIPFLAIGILWSIGLIRKIKRRPEDQS